MRSREENYLTMALTTLKVLYKNEAIWTTNVPFSALVNKINDNADLMAKAQKGGIGVSTGATGDKTAAADAAIAYAVRLSKLAQVFARNNNDRTLHDQIKLTEDGLHHYADTELTPALEKFRDQLNEIIDPLLAYGVTPANLDNLTGLIAQYEDFKSNPRIIITERKSHNADIPAILRELRDCFDKLDRLINIWSESDPLFLSNYANARIIIDLGGRHDGPPPPEGPEA